VVRFDTYKAGAFLVWQLKHAGAIIHEDGGDIIHLSLPTGEGISIHIIESSIPAYEIKNTIAYNQANGLYTLFILWADMLLPPEGHVIEVEDWEWPLLALYGDKLWAYDIFGGELFIYPIHYDRIGPYREIRYGKTVNMRQLQGMVVEVESPFIRGRWRVATFSDKAPHKYHRYQTDTDGQKPPRSTQPDSYAEYYAILGISLDAEEEDVKTAYRNLARKIHPDVNKAPDATAQMQALNDAYRRLMSTFEDE
jgi:hypothetical protein